MKPIILSVFLFLIQCASTNQSIYRTLAQELSSANNQKTIAVMPFEGNSKDFEPVLLAEKLTHELVKSGNYQIIERSKIDQVLKEQSLAQTGITSQEELIKIGKLVSADGVVVVSVIRENQYTTIIARIVDTQSGKIWSSSRVSFLAKENSPSKQILTPPINIVTSKADNTYKPIESTEKPKAEIKDLQLLRNGKFGRFIGLLKNESNSVISGSKLYINLKDKKNSFLDTVLCFIDKPIESGEEVPFSCIVSDFPSEYGSHEIFFEPETRFYGNYTPFKILSEKFKEDSSGLEGFTLTGILQNNTELTITYPKIILSLYDGNKKFLGSAISFGNQKKLTPGESTSFKVSAYSYSLAGKPKSYKVQTHALASSRVQ